MQRIDRCRKTTICNAENHGLFSGVRLTIPHAAASSLVHGCIVRLSDVHLDMASDAGTVNILRGITLDIAAGETAAVVGPSRAPKPRLLMLPHPPSPPPPATVAVAPPHH